MSLELGLSIVRSPSEYYGNLITAKGSVIVTGIPVGMKIAAKEQTEVGSIVVTGIPTKMKVGAREQTGIGSIVVTGIAANFIVT